MKREIKFARLLLVLLLAVAVARAQTDSSAQQEPASVSGVITNSVNGEPLAHARVILANEAGAQTCSLIDNTCRYTVTAADGRFAIRTIAPGKYQMVVERRGYGPLADEQENRKHLELKSGEEINHVALQLVPDAVISGRVLDSKGVPLEHGAVQAVGGGSPRFGVIDDHGEFRIGGLRAGRYLVKTVTVRDSERRLPPEIRTDGTAEVVDAPTYYPSSLNPRSAEPVEARAGEETAGVEIRLVPAPTLHVSGTASNIREGARGFAISLSSGQHTFNSRHADVEPDLTFTFWRVLPGRYQVSILYCSDTPGNWSMRGIPVEINVTNASIEGIQLSCADVLELPGHIEVEGGAAIPSQKERTLSVKLLSLGSIYDEHSEHINPDGTFRIPEVAPGRYHLMVEGLPEDFYAKSAHVGTIDLHDGILDLRNGIDPKSLLTVQLGANGAQVSGVARDATGPVAGARVALFFDDEYGSDVAASTSTGTEGRYTLHGIPPGKYNLVAYDPKSSAVVWLSEALALHAPVIESVHAGEGDKILRDLRVMRPR